MGGVVLCDKEFLDQHLQVFLRNTGPAISPFNAWLHLKSLETLIQRRADDAQRHAARREQRHTDEAAQRTAAHSSSPAGSHSTADLHRI